MFQKEGSMKKKPVYERDERKDIRSEDIPWWIGAPSSRYTEKGDGRKQSAAR